MLLAKLARCVGTCDGAPSTAHYIDFVCNDLCFISYTLVSVQANQNLPLVHMSEGMFSDVETHNYAGVIL